MTTISIWPGSSSFSSGSTTWHFWDSESTFQTDIDKFAQWASYRLGYPIVSIELQDRNFYAAFEEAINEYSNQVNTYNITQNLLNLIGSSTSSNYTGRVITPTLHQIIQISDEYGSEVYANGAISFYTASIDIVKGQQVYDLNTLVRDVKAPSQSIEIKRVHHYAPVASNRFYDPMLGCAQILNEFGFGGMSTAVSFMLMPMYADLLRIQAIEFNDQMRKSAYSFQILNNSLRIFPVPEKEFKLWMDFIIKEERANPLREPAGRVSDLSNAPFDLMKYNNINSTGKQWIYKYALAVCKEMLGYIRGKYSSIPIPNADTTLNAADLISAAGTEKQALVEELKGVLENSTRVKQLENKKSESEFLADTLTGAPLRIYIG